MDRALVLLCLALAAASASGCVDGDLNDLPPTGATHCTPGRQDTCACGGGAEGFQLCNVDGSSFGECVCSDAAATDVRSDTGAGAADSSSVTDTSMTSPDTMPAPVDTMPAPVDTAPGPTWVWIDRGGPAFQPHACPDGPGVAGGKLVDPKAFFAALVKGRSAADWVRVMNDIEPSLWACGVGQQRDSGGNVRGRLFLPNASCPDAAPPTGDALAIKLGVRQERDCWTHAVDVVEG